MSGCEALVAGATGGVAPALRAVDCMTAEAAATSFARLFGANGALLPALTILLTLYVGLFAIGLLTGRTRLGISALTPRMMTLGLVLTFATSWLAWQGVVWNLAAGAPDQLAAILMGVRGSATEVFAGRIDIVFAAIAEVAGGGAGADATRPSGGTFSPQSLVWLAALLLLLGTVGVLVTSKIVLAVLLAVGPVFVVLALFSGTRGLFAGWLRGLALTALAPVIVVLGGMVVLELLAPVIAAMRAGEEIDGRAAIALFTLACVHVALVALAMRVAHALVAGWDVFGLAPAHGGGRGAGAGMAAPFVPTALAPASLVPEARRAAGVAAALQAGHAASAAGPASSSVTVRATAIVPFASSSALSGEARPARRAHGIGSRFRAPVRPRPLREISR